MSHLILHKVRGQPAFDIAEPIQIGDEEGWIIPTSGHRAYPYATWELSTLGIINGWPMPLKPITEGISLQPPTSDWPDHYQTERTPQPQKGLNLMDYITLPQPKIKLVRRRL